MKRRYSSANTRILAIGFVFLFTTLNLQKKISPLEQNDYGMPHNDAHLSSRTTPKPQPTLVHFDPYFMGGFRNQHMRFVAFVANAVNLNISQILLPSLRWGDPYNKSKSIHHELLFDVQYWNSRADSLGLPFLVNYDPNVLEGIIPNTGGNESATTVVPCWNETSGLYSGVDEALLRNPGTNLRKIHTWGMIGQGEIYSHCRRTPWTDENDPIKIEEAARQDDNSTNSTSNKVYRFTHLTPHGGLISSGRLWWEYSNMQKNRGRASEPTLINSQLVYMHPEHVQIERAIYELLRPSHHLRLATENAIQMVLQNNATSNARPRVLALHPRVEQEMLTHRCNKFMESNLTKVFERLETFSPFLDGSNSSEYRFDLVFVAVSKKEVDKTSTRDSELGRIMNGNRDALHHARNYGLFNSSSSSSGTSSRMGIPIFESGTDSAAKIQFPRIQQSTLQFVTNGRPGAGERIYPQTVPAENRPFVSALDLGVLELVASIINFFTAVKAEIFVGVKGSTYSTDVFSVRYYQHKEEGGGENYIVGPGGIERLYGPAAPHACA
mmetsp:Transcript_34293/g.63110  ORF Transcript_34293/g.63110 Transcript_34293/m.63110 type:complete len:553 (+) Transcript_34293:40-1698(+)